MSRTTFEGEHRCGKGTQIELAVAALGDGVVVVRGDGSYQGGLEAYVSEEELQFRNSLNEVLYKETSGSDRLWGIAATACAASIGFPQFADKNLLIDRGPLSRATYLLSHGVQPRDVSSLLYPQFTFRTEATTIQHDAIHVEDVDFGNIIYIQVPTSVLLDRIEDSDPKADFRRRNIVSKIGLFDMAVECMPESVQDAVVIVNGNMPPADVFDQYAHLLD